jgi:hypothetical protein
MTMLQLAQRRPIEHKIFDAHVRQARELIELAETHSFHAHIKLGFASEAVFNCLRDLACLLDWWPHARALHPIPPGLCKVGDMGILQVGQHFGLLRVLAFKPGKRIFLALSLSLAPVLLELSVLPAPAVCGSQCCSVRVGLESPCMPNARNHVRRQRWLEILGAKAERALHAHLLRSSRLGKVDLG